MKKQQFTNDLGVFNEGFAVVERQGEWFHISTSGEPAYTERYAYAENFQGGVAWVKEKSGRWKIIDKDGKETKSR